MDEPRPIRTNNEDEATRLAYLQVEDPSRHFVTSNDQGGCDVYESDGIGPDVLLYRFVS
jgi:hypothetical protein